MMGWEGKTGRDTGGSSRRKARRWPRWAATGDLPGCAKLGISVCFVVRAGRFDFDGGGVSSRGAAIREGDKRGVRFLYVCNPPHFLPVRA